MKKITYNNDNLHNYDIDETTTRTRGLIINSNNEILMCYSNGLSHYEFPGGHLEKNETLYGGLKREIYEETGITLTKKEVEPFMVIKYYCKNYHKTNKNRLVEIYYYIIKTDKKYDLNKIKLDQREIEQNYECIYIKINELKAILLNNKKTNKENNSMLDDMLLVWDEYLKKDIS